MGLLDIFGRKRTRSHINENYVFDKAKYHDGTCVELGLDEDQSFVHTGLFLAWLVNNDLVSKFFITESRNEINALKARNTSPSQIYMNWDGVLLGEMLNEEGYNFAMAYFDFNKGSYLNDYENIFCQDNEHIFGVKDTWENYDILRPAIDFAYQKWKK